MMKFNYTLLSFFCILFIVSCDKNETSLIQKEELQAEVPDIVLGKKLENPYTVENMQKAYDKLNKESALKSSFNITTTDLYVRFLPKDSTELSILETDSLFLFDYPLDYEIEQVQYLEEEQESSTEGDQWYYTSVPVNYEFPDVQYEILANLCLPPEDEDETKSSSIWSDIEDKALEITGNSEEIDADDQTELQTKSSKQRPEGYVRVMDTNKGSLVGVEKVRVRTRRWFKYGRDYTDKDGFYSVDRRYRRSVHYCVFFKNELGFKIRKGMFSLWKAKHHVGKHNRRGYDINIGTGSRAWRFATLNNAVVKYWELCDKFGIEKPHSNLRLIARSKKDGAVGAAPMLKHV